MKKLILIFSLLVCILGAKAQSTGTIVDNGPYLTVNYANGDTLSIGKGLIAHLKSHNNTVYLMTARKWGTDKITRILSLNPDDFGYADVSTLRRHLETICFNAYREVYSYDGSSNLDTIHYYYGTTLQYSVAFAYTGANLTSKTIVTY